MEKILLEALNQQYELTKKVAIAISNEKFDDVRNEWNKVMNNTELLLKSAGENVSTKNSVLPIHGVRLSLPFNDLYKALDDNRMKPHVDSESVWHLYRKQTAEHLLDNYDIYGKGNEA